MAKKNYRTYFLKSLDIHFRKDDGNTIDVVFRGGIQIDSTAKFSTKDKAIQDLLEGSSGFGRDYYLESVEEDAKAPAAPVEEKPKESKKEEKKELTDVKDIRRFRNLVEMKSAMKELGFDVKDDWNYMSCKAAAQKEGYDFQISR